MACASYFKICHIEHGISQWPKKSHAIIYNVSFDVMSVLVIDVLLIILIQPKVIHV